MTKFFKTCLYNVFFCDIQNILSKLYFWLFITYFKPNGVDAFCWHSSSSFCCQCKNLAFVPRFFFLRYVKKVTWVNFSEPCLIRIKKFFNSIFIEFLVFIICNHISDKYKYVVRIIWVHKQFWLLCQEFFWRGHFNDLSFDFISLFECWLMILGDLECLKWKIFSLEKKNVKFLKD